MKVCHSINAISLRDFKDSIKELCLSNSLTQQHQIICASHYIVDEIQHHIAKHQVASTWDTANVNTWLGWVLNTWDEISYLDEHSPLLISEHQRQYIFDNLLNRDSLSPVTPHEFHYHSVNNHDLRSLSNSLLSHWNFAKEWNLSLDDLSYQNTDESKIFHSICSKYKDILQRHNWIDAKELPSYICQSIGTNQYNISNNTFTFVGFDFYNENQSLLIDKLKSNNIINLVTVTEHQNTNLNNHKNYLEKAYPSAYQEVSDVLNDAKKLLELKPSHRIAIVSPNLAESKNIYESYLLNLNNSKQSEQSYHINLPFSHVENPALNIINHLLHCCQESFNYSHFSKLLLSSFIWQDKNFTFDSIHFRHLIDRDLRSVLPELVNLDNIMSALKDIIRKVDKQHEQYVITSKLILNYCHLIHRKISSTESRFRTYNDGNKWLSDLLNNMDWYGYSPKGFINAKNTKWSSSATLNILHSLLDTINELALIDNHLFSKRSLTISSLQSQFSKQLNKSNNSNRNYIANIQIFDVKHCAGLEFQHIFFVGFSHRSWPLKKSQYPFIPKNILEESDIILIDDIEFNQLSKTIFINRYSSALISLSLSYHTTHNDNEYLPCSLFMSTSLNTVPQIDVDRILYNDSLFDSYVDETINIEKQQSISIQGGADAIKNYIACPLKSYFRNKLSILSPEESQTFLQPKIHGVAIHNILENFWNIVQNQNSLIELRNSSELKSLVERIVSDYVDSIQYSDSYLIIKSMYKPLLTSLILEWLEIELSRPPFKILSQEKQVVYHINNAVIKLRIDRIDELCNGQHLIIDYKSGASDTNNWKGEFIKEPQLPIYLLMLHDLKKDPDVNIGIAYASIKSNDLFLKGIAQNNTHGDLLIDVNLMRFVKEMDMNDLINFWQELFINTVDSIALGIYPATPTKDACIHCEYKSVCRINSLSS